MGVAGNAPSSSFPVANGPGIGFGANVFYSYWFVKSDHLGKVSVGLQSSAADNAAILVDGSGSLVPANWVQFDNAAFFIRSKNGALSTLGWGSHHLKARPPMVGRQDCQRQSTAQRPSGERPTVTLAAPRQ